MNVKLHILRNEASLSRQLAKMIALTVLKLECNEVNAWKTSLSHSVNPYSSPNLNQPQFKSKLNRKSIYKSLEYLNSRTK